MADAAAALHRWLDRLALRSGLGPQEREAILSLPGEFQHIPPNRDFVRLGEQVDRACLIVAGMAGRFGQSRNGDRQITAFHIPGDMADLHSVVLPDCRHRAAKHRRGDDLPRAARRDQKRDADLPRLGRGVLARLHG